MAGRVDQVQEIILAARLFPSEPHGDLMECFFTLQVPLLPGPAHAFGGYSASL